MQTHIDLRFVGLNPDNRVEQAVYARIGQLAPCYREASAWRVIVQQERRLQEPAQPYSVRLDFSLPGRDLAVTRMHDDVQAALQAAFEAMRRKFDGLGGPSPAN